MLSSESPGSIAPGYQHRIGNRTPPPRRPRPSPPSPPTPSIGRRVQFGKPAFGRGDEIRDGLAHLSEHLIGRNAAYPWAKISDVTTCGGTCILKTYLGH